MAAVLITGVALEVVVRQNWGNPVHSKQIEITAADGAGAKYAYQFDSQHPDLDLAKDLLASIAAHRGQVPWQFMGDGTKIVGAVPLVGPPTSPSAAGTNIVL